MNKIRQNKTLVLFMCLVYLFFLSWHLLVEIGNSDDAGFMLALNNQDLISYLINRYNTWSSRIVIEGVLVLILKLPSIIWRLLNPLMFVLAYYSILKIANVKNNFIINLFLSVFMCIMPFSIYSSAGWVTTTINYVWPLALGLWCLSIMIDVSDDKKVCVFLYILALIFSSNMEQMCAVLLGFNIILNAYYIYTKKKINKILLVSLLVILVMLVLELICPGNVSRSEVSALSFYPNNLTYNTLDKVVIGVFSTISYILVHTKSPIYLLLLSVMLLGISSKKKNTAFISFGPTFIYGILEILTNQKTKSGYLYDITSTIDEYARVFVDVKLSFGLVVLIIFALASTICIIYCLFKTLDKKLAITICVILLASFLSRVIMGFSPSLYESDERTFVFMYYLILLVDVLILDKIFKSLSYLIENKDK